MHHRGGREYRHHNSHRHQPDGRPRRGERVILDQDHRKQAEEGYYDIRSKVEAKIKQEVEKAEARAKEKEERERSKDEEKEPHDDVRKDEEDEKPREDDDNERRRSRRNSRERGDQNEDTEKNDHQEQHSKEHSSEGQGATENGSDGQEANASVKPEMVKPQSPLTERKPFFGNNNTPQNTGNNTQVAPYVNNNKERKFFIVNKQNQSGTWHSQNNHSHMNSFYNEPTSEFQKNLFLMANDPSNCKFYMKTGACRFGPRCSRNHVRFEDSPTVMIPNFFQDPRLGVSHDHKDASKDYDEVEMIHEFEKFYDDVIGEFRAAGTVVMFKCCQNYVPHLRGNVYVEYSKPEMALEALNMFNGRFYAGRQLEVELSPVTSWKSSICGLFDKRLCPRGQACNFLHVFRNPGNAYSVPNRTDFNPERAFKTGGYDPSFVNPNHPVFKYYNQRDAYGYRSETAKPSKPRMPPNKWDNDKNERSRSTSRSKDRSRKNRSHSRSRSHSKSRSRSRSRSRSKKRKHSRSKSHSHSKSRSRSRSKSRSKEKSKKSRSRKHSHSSNSSHGSGKKKKHDGNNSDVSDTSTDWSDISLDD